MKFLLVLVLSALAFPLAAQTTDLYVSKNMFTPGAETVDIQVSTVNYPNALSLRVYNSAGELVRILGQTDTTGPFTQTYTWDGKNVNGEKVGSGVYLIFFKADQIVHTARILAVQ